MGLTVWDEDFLFCAHLIPINIFSFLMGVELRHFFHRICLGAVWFVTFFPSEMLRGCLVYVICNSIRLYSFILKRCIVIVHTLNMCTSYFVHI